MQLSPLALCRRIDAVLNCASANPALGLARTATGPWASACAGRARGDVVICVRVRVGARLLAGEDVCE